MDLKPQLMVKWYDRNRHLNANNYLLVICSQVVLVLAPAIFDYISVGLIAIIASTAVVLISSYILSNGRRELFLASGLGITAIVGGWINQGTTADTFYALDNFASMAFYMYAALLLGRRVIQTHTITMNVLYAAISGFFFLGFIGGHLLRLIHLTSPDAFNIAVGTDTYAYTYFSFVTITTLGYGDIVPQTTTGQAASVILAICGQMYITTIIAVIVGRLSS